MNQANQEANYDEKYQGDNLDLNIRWKWSYSWVYSWLWVPKFTLVEGRAMYLGNRSFYNVDGIGNI